VTRASPGDAPPDPDHGTGGWKAAQASVTGASHRREGRTNQDACAIRAGAAAVVAVADGHGSARYRHSARGAELACAVAQELGDELLGRAAELGVPALGEELERDGALGRDVLRRWLERVQGETEDEGAEAFGTTLIFAVLADDLSLFFQLGDGDLLVVDDGGELRAPLPEDPLLLGTSTTSLVTPDAWAHARVAVVAAEGYRSRVVVATTDGVSSSFTSSDGMSQFVRGIERLVMGAEPSLVEERLHGVLERYTAGGSGDDVTVVVAWRDEGVA
jgi:hypothetical protein